MEKINKLRRKLKSYNLDGYLIPKNDEFFNEFIPENKDYLRDISNFSGSYGIALILKKIIICLLMVDILCKQIYKVENISKSLHCLLKKEK